MTVPRIITVSPFMTGPRFMKRARIGATLLAAVGFAALPLAAQTCPSEYSACDNGGCCLSAEQCCPTLAEGCCSSSTPYCCGDGTCAATPSQCQQASGANCDGYDVPCGGGCAPAGSHCCDEAGHYCPPESRCTSDTTCVFGTRPTLALEVAVEASPETSGPPPLSPPFEDPEDATERSCGLVRGGAGHAGPPWVAVLAVLAWAARRRATPARG